MAFPVTAACMHCLLCPVQEACIPTQKLKHRLFVLTDFTYIIGCLHVQAKELETELDAALIAVEDQISVESCKDHDVSCTSHGRQLYRSNQSISMSNFCIPL